MSLGTQSKIEVKSAGYQSKSIEVLDFKYENSEVPQDLIDQCEKASESFGETYFIFDNSVSNFLKSRYMDDKSLNREIKIDEILGHDEKFHIGSETYFREMPSRFSYYDTETKECNRYKKYNIVIDFIKSLGFSPSEFNLGPEFDQSFTFKHEDINLILRLKPNLFLTIQDGFTDSFHPNNIFDGFFSKSKIFKAVTDRIPIDVIRGLKLKEIII